MLFYFAGLFVFRLQGLSRIRVCAGLIPRIVLLACLFWGTGFFGRIDPGFVAEDASVGNRAVLWQGGAQMLWQKPLAGWGVGESGPQFMHWYQPVDATAKYAGMVNSYLHVGVERGLPFLMRCLAVLLCFVWLGLFRVSDTEPNGRKSPHAISLAAASVIVVFLVSNIFNTLWIFPRLWIPVGLAAAYILFVVLLAPGRGSLFKRSLGLSLISSLLLGASMLVIGSVLAAKAPDRISFDGNTVVLGTGSSEPPDSQWLLAMDPRIFGGDWGKEVRRLAHALRGSRVDLVVLPLQESQIVLPKDWSGRFFRIDQVKSPPVLLTSGRLLPPPELSGAIGRMIWFHPDVTESLSEDALTGFGSNTRLLFPMMDLSGGQAAWKRAARQRGWTLAASGALTDDIRPVWPESAMNTLLSQIE
jgi:hypothetical protein